MADEESRRFPFEITEAVDIASHPFVILLLAPFIVVFLWAAWMEFSRWWRYGPSENKRASFPFDPSAPGFELDGFETRKADGDTHQNDDSEQGKNR
ncbi:hypothetical protein DQW77_06435 [Roseovarius sp. TE539]|uniref:hypothetical protein n=1 Tax=Roseovarius sp. TE539 TaxID=2249812 RepID=UPI000DDF8E0D|nr:hypothetical protein [Roseovarius sp. TE539]RBI75283.1 hypothetical protein DQW77_06435 [Roseovarius sp. TE539]